MRSTGGEIADDIVGYLKPQGSLLSLTDFARHRSDWVEPVSTRFHGAEILEIPPSGQGLTALIALNVLARFDLAAAGPNTLRAQHLQIEAMKLAWVLRSRFIADPDFAEVPVAELLSDRMADRLAALIRPDRALEDPANRVPMTGSDTVYLTVVDRNRMAVSLINSLYWGFGSGRVTPKTGITLQNRGAGFVTDPGHPNCIGPGKRPLHTIIPAMARVNGKVALSFGVMGGAYQPMGHVTVALNRFVHGMDLQQAIDAPRLFPEGGLVQVESGIPAALCSGLEAIGHRLAPTAKPLGGAQAIAIDWQGGGLEGGSDSRKDGMALGYD